jgi:NADH-quinone oxidoreductase subunit I
VVGDDGKPQKLPWEDWREGDDEHTSAWMRATSPSGSAEFEGLVSWAGELGYGVRKAERGQTNADDAVAEPAQEREVPDVDEVSHH